MQEKKSGLVKKYLPFVLNKIGIICLYIGAIPLILLLFGYILNELAAMSGNDPFMTLEKGNLLLANLLNPIISKGSLDYPIIKFFGGPLFCLPLPFALIGLSCVTLSQVISGKTTWKELWYGKNNVR